MEVEGQYELGRRPIVKLHVSDDPSGYKEMAHMDLAKIRQYHERSGCCNTFWEIGLEST